MGLSYRLYMEPGFKVLTLLGSSGGARPGTARHTPEAELQGSSSFYSFTPRNGQHASSVSTLDVPG